MHTETIKVTDCENPIRSRRLHKIAMSVAMVVGMSITSGLAMAQQNDARGPVWTPVTMPEQASQTEGMVELDDGMNLRYWDTGGTGTPIVLLHAASSSADMWGYQQPILVSSGYRVIAYDRRGYAGSSPTDKERPGIAAEDLRMLMDHLGVEQTHILSAAHGGSFAMDFAVSYPERVKSLILLSSTLSLKEDDWKAISARVHPKKAWNPLPPAMKELSPSYRAGNPEGMADWERLQSQAFPGGRKAWVSPKYSAVMTWQHVEQFKGPMMIVTGDADTYLSPAQMRLQASHFPQAEVYVISEAAHTANWEQPEAFNSLMLGFLSRVEQ